MNKWHKIRKGHIMPVPAKVDAINNFKRPATVSTVFQYVVPTDRRETLINSFHDSPIAGHFNNETVAKSIQHRFFWPGAWSQIKRHCRECDRCARAKTTPSNRPEMIPITATQPFEITFDIMGPLQPLAEDDSRYILVLMCHFTKWAVTRAIKDARAKTVALVIFCEIICKHGCPKRILSDQARNFNADVMRELAALFDIDKRNTTPYHPECDGQTERFNRTLGAMLRAMTNEWGDI